jgi:chromosome segregation ATPase
MDYIATVFVVLRSIISLFSSDSSNNDSLRKEFQLELDNMKTNHANDLRSRDMIIAQKDIEIMNITQRLEQTLKDMEGLKQDNLQLRAEIADLKIQVGELQGVVRALLNDNKELKLQNQELKLQNQELKLQNQELKLQNQEILKNHEEILKQNREMKETNNKILMHVMKGDSNTMNFQNG